MRIALGVEYDGRLFSGWEIQDGRETVQGCVEFALAKIADAPIRTVCAGRTDAGVHAWGQVVHFDTEKQRPLRAWVRGTNTELPDTVSVLWAQCVPEEFHARYSAQSRHYRYLIVNRETRPGVLNARVGWEYRALAVDQMKIAASYLLGEHDFSAFRAAGCQAKSAIRTLFHLEVRPHGDLIVIDVVGNAFLQHMVRNIVGSLIEVGVGKRAPEWIRELLDCRDRTRGGPPCRPTGFICSRSSTRPSTICRECRLP